MISVIVLSRRARRKNRSFHIDSTRARAMPSKNIVSAYNPFGNKFPARRISRVPFHSLDLERASKLSVSPSFLSFRFQRECRGGSARIRSQTGDHGTQKLGPSTRRSKKIQFIDKNKNKSHLSIFEIK